MLVQLLNSSYSNQLLNSYCCNKKSFTFLQNKARKNTFFFLHWKKFTFQQYQGMENAKQQKKQSFPNITSVQAYKNCPIMETVVQPWMLIL